MFVRLLRSMSSTPSLHNLLISSPSSFCPSLPLLALAPAPASELSRPPPSASQPHFPCHQFPSCPPPPPPPPPQRWSLVRAFQSLPYRLIFLAPSGAVPPRLTCRFCISNISHYQARRS